MAGRRGWNGDPPEDDEQARHKLLQAARACIDEGGGARASLGDVAQRAGVTRQTVYRYFEDTDDLFRSAAVLASGGFHERLRKRVLRETTLADRIAESIVFAVTEIPKDAYLGALVGSDVAAELPFLLVLRFVREDLASLTDGEHDLDDARIDELAELLLRLLLSFLQEPGPPRTRKQLRAVVRGWTRPVLDGYRRTRC